MIARYKIDNEKYKMVDIKEDGFYEGEIEQSPSGRWYMLGYAPKSVIVELKRGVLEVLKNSITNYLEKNDYSLVDQINILRSNNKEEIDKMNTIIDGVRNEYKQLKVLLQDEVNGNTSENLNTIIDRVNKLIKANIKHVNKDTITIEF